MELEEKKYLTLLFVIPILVTLFLLYQFWKNRKQKRFAQANLFQKLSPDRSVLKSTLKLIVLLLGISALILALANPRIGTKIETVKREGIDIVFAVDVSKSMLAEDVAPNRLEKSKQIVSQIINTLGTDRVGIVVYAASAFPLLPMTTDYGSAKMFLQQMNTDMLSSQGTAIREAIILASTYFDDPQTNKLLVLISDGEDHEQNIPDALEQAKEKKLKILTIGVGTEKGERIPIKIGGTTQGYMRDRNNDIVITKLDESTLREIAKQSGGDYVLGNNSKQVTSYFQKIVDTIEKTQFESQEVAEYDSKFQWFLGLAFFLITLDVFFLEKKTTWLRKLNLFNEKNK